MLRHVLKKGTQTSSIVLYLDSRGRCVSDRLAILPVTMSQNHSHVFMNIILIKRKKVEHVVLVVRRLNSHLVSPFERCPKYGLRTNCSLTPKNMLLVACHSVSVNQTSSLCNYFLFASIWQHCHNVLFVIKQSRAQSSLEIRHEQTSAQEPQAAHLIGNAALWYLTSWLFNVENY